mgnify:CR=1 FL=1
MLALCSGAERINRAYVPFRSRCSRCAACFTAASIWLGADPRVASSSRDLFCELYRVLCVTQALAFTRRIMDLLPDQWRSRGIVSVKWQPGRSLEFGRSGSCVDARSNGQDLMDAADDSESVLGLSRLAPRAAVERLAERRGTIAAITIPMRYSWSGGGRADVAAVVVALRVGAIV